MQLINSNTKKQTKLFKTINRSCLVASFLVMVWNASAYAHSAWIWTTDNRPWHLFPVTITTAILIEYLAIIYLGKATCKKITFLSVSLANIMAYVVPYSRFIVANEIEFIPTYIFPVNDISFIANFYIPIKIFLMFSIFIGLAKKSGNPARLLFAISISSLISFALISYIEITFAPGWWT